MATKKTGKKTAANGNTKAEKFVELAQKRTTRAINNMRSIGKLSNRGNYAYTDEQVNKICEALKNEVVELHKLFTTDPKQSKGGFEL